jgi:hypothetical protein
LVEQELKARGRIPAARIIDQMVAFYQGVGEMTRDQIKVGEILLRKVLPDLQQVSVTQSEEKANTVTTESILAELNAAAARRLAMQATQVAIEATHR